MEENTQELEGDSGQESRDTVHLKRRVKLYQAVAFVIATIVGSTIYISPGDVLQFAGSPWAALGVWIGAGLLSLSGALCYAELATTFPASGEKLHYLDVMYGPFPAFCYSLGILMFVRPGADAIKLMIFGRYILALFFPDCDIPEAGMKLIAVLVLILIASVNVVNIEVANRVHSVVTGVSILALIVFSVIGTVYLGSGHTHRWFKISTKIPSMNAGDFVFAMYIALYAYSGWFSLNFIVEEVKNPSRNVPIALLMSVGGVTVLYTLVNTAYITVLGPDGVITSPAVGVSFGQVAFPVVAWLVPLVVCSSQLSSCNSGLLIASRLMFTTARRGLLPQCLALITTWSYSPVTALLFESVFVCACVVLFDITSLIKNLMFFVTVFEMLVMIGMIRLRVKQPDLHRPFKTPFPIPVAYLVVNILLLAVPIVTKPSEAVIGALFGFGTAIPLYVVFVGYRWRPKSLTKVIGKVTRTLQKLFMCVPQEQEVTK